MRDGDKEMTFAVRGRKGKFLLPGVVLLYLFATAHVEAAALKVEDVAKELICLCGCNKLVNDCEMQDWAVAAKVVIKEKINEGWSKERIVAYFVEQYGPKVLAAPPKKGFNLTAWTTPFILIGVGAVLILFLLRAWVMGRGKREEVERQALEQMSQEEVSRYKQELELELKSRKY